MCLPSFKTYWQQGRFETWQGEGRHVLIRKTCGLRVCQNTCAVYSFGSQNWWKRGLEQSRNDSGVPLASMDAPGRHVRGLQGRRDHILGGFCGLTFLTFRCFCSSGFFVCFPELFFWWFYSDKGDKSETPEASQNVSASCLKPADARGTPESFRDCSGPRFHQFCLPNAAPIQP